MTPLRFVLVGTGNIAGTYAVAAEKVDSVEIVAAVSRDAERGRAFADEHGLDGSATSLEGVETAFDAVILATPNGAHHAGAVAAAGLGKHVLSEKPLDITAANMDRMIAACREAGVRLGCAYIRRTRENNRIIKSLLAEGAFGRLYAVDMSLKVYRPQAYYDSGPWRGTKALDGGGPFMQQGSHDIDLLCWLFGMPTEVTAKVGTFGHTGIDVEDHGAAVCELPGGALISIVASTVARPGFDPRMDVITERGTFSMVNDCISFWGIEGMDDPCVAPTGDQHSATSAAVKDTSGHEAILADFAEAVRDGRDPLVPGEQARQATDLILAVYRAAELGRTVRP